MADSNTHRLTQQYGNGFVNQKGLFVRRKYRLAPYLLPIRPGQTRFT